ncbi:MAG: cell division protein ZapA [Deltaproteobacteria bacterium]|nr:cell division protein ZapA [Deltaproteobacteria bacterium]
MSKRPVEVQIAGERFVVRSDADETYVRILAGYVDERIGEVQRASRLVPTQKLVVLAALNIADDLFQERRKRAELKRRVRDKSKAVLAYLEKEEQKHLTAHE